MTEPKIIALPTEAIRLWKEPDSSIKNTTINDDLLWKIFSKGALTVIMISGSLIMTAPIFTHAPLTSNLTLLFILVSVLTAIVDMGTTFFMTVRWYGRGRIYSTRTMILYGCGYDGIDPDDCDVEGSRDTYERRYLIKPKPTSRDFVDALIHGNNPDYEALGETVARMHIEIDEPPEAEGGTHPPGGTSSKGL